MTDTHRLAEILALSREQRLEIAAAIWDSLAENAEAVPMPPWHRDLLEERLEEDAAAPEPGLSWSEARRRIEKRS